MESPIPDRPRDRAGIRDASAGESEVAAPPDHGVVEPVDLLRQQLAIVYRQLPIVLVVTVLAAAALFAVYHGRVPPVPAASWLATITAIQLVRAWSWRRHRRCGGDRDPTVWGRIFFAGTVATGAMWGTTAWIFYVPDSPVLQIFLMLILVGLPAGAVSALSGWVPAYWGFALPLATPLTLRFLDEGDRLHLALAFLMVLAVVGMGLLVRNLNRLLLGHLRLSIERESLLRDLAAARDRAEDASAAKSEFLANVSHELRTPLNGVVGYADLLRSQPYGPLGDPKYREFAENIVAAGRHLSELITDIIDIARVEARRIDLVDRPFDPLGLARAALAMVAPTAEPAEVAIALEDRSQGAWLRADRRRVMQILLNLLSNAIKFTPSGGSIRVAVDRAEDGGLVLAVRDTGIGMKPEEIPKALMPFAQIGSPVRPGHDGMGLGLPLVEALVDLHGGTLSIDSRPGGGTEVRVRFPPERTEAPRDGADGGNPAEVAEEEIWEPGVGRWC